MFHVDKLQEIEENKKFGASDYGIVNWRND